ncbi:MAG: hypothetical protein LH485_08685 [Sphingomonas bacterium]|nr:hypothetical protein [Sphingomonas bacterium]
MTMTGTGAFMFYTDFAAQVGKAEALKRFALVAVVTLPLITWLISKSIDDFAAFRAAWPTKATKKKSGS